VFLSLANLVLAQKKPSLHTPAELIKIMTDSKVTYTIGQLDSVIKPPDLTSHLNYNDVYRKTTASGFATVRLQR
jgi:hypothetical protein